MVKVIVTIEKEVDGREGVLQFIHKVIDEFHSSVGTDTKIYFTITK